jgi:predicted patatin/cPLA2 family phospholipase|tara:strand:- start:245 stop:547 length:303 start_codon:yes stop_codon:yes gene_type:complete
MTEFTSLTSILSTIELKLNGAMSVSNDQKLFNENINEIENLLKKTNAFIIEKNNDHQFSDIEKELIKKIFDLIIKLEKINNNKLGFFDSLNKYFYDNIDK